jgi:hypothetical protein
MTTDTVGRQVCKGIEALIAKPGLPRLTTYQTSRADRYTSVRA